VVKRPVLHHRSKFYFRPQISGFHWKWSYSVSSAYDAPQPQWALRESDVLMNAIFLFKVRSLDKTFSGKYPYFCRYINLVQDRSKEAAVPKPSPIRPSIWIEHWLVTNTYTRPWLVTSLIAYLSAADSLPPDSDSLHVWYTVSVQRILRSDHCYWPRWATGIAIDRVRLCVCFHSRFKTSWPLTLIFACI